MFRLVLVILCSACGVHTTGPPLSGSLSALHAALTQRTSTYPNPWNGEIERIELVKFDQDEDLFVALFDSQAHWWGDFVVFCADGSDLRWVATIPEKDEPLAAYGVSARGFRLPGFPEPFVEVVWSSHRGNGDVYLYELREQRLRLVLSATAVDRERTEGSVFRGGVLSRSYADVDGDGHLDVSLTGTRDQVDPETGEVLSSRAVHRHFVWQPVGRVFAPSQTAGRIRSDRFLGRWNALSRNHRSISGDMVIRQDRIMFSRKGHVEFTVLRFDGREYMLRLSRVVDDGRFLRLGPISPTDSGEQMEAAYYEDAESTLVPRKHAHSGSASWGVYVR